MKPMSAPDLRLDNRLFVWAAVIGLVLATFLLAGLHFSGIGDNLAGGRSWRWPRMVFTCGLLFFAATWVIWRCPTVIEFGDRLDIRWLLWWRCFDWSAVKRIRIDKPREYRRLTIEIESGPRISRTVSGEEAGRLREIAARRGLPVEGQANP
jgi:hypothetical protein